MNCFVSITRLHWLSSFIIQFSVGMIREFLYEEYGEISASLLTKSIPDSKVHGANMGPIWGRQDPGGPHVDPMNFANWDVILETFFNTSAYHYQLKQIKIDTKKLNQYLLPNISKKLVKLTFKM